FTACRDFPQRGHFPDRACIQPAGRRIARRAGPEDRAEVSTPESAAGTEASGTPRRRNSRKFILKCLIAAIFIGAFGAFFAFDGPHYLALDAIKQNRDALLALTRAHYLLSLVVAFVIY